MGFNYSSKWLVGFVSVIIILLLPAIINPPLGLTDAAFVVLCLMLAMGVLWVLELIPMPATALLPLVYLPISGVGIPLNKLIASYSHPIVFLFLGGFVLGMAMEKHNLHKRIAFGIMSLFGTEPKKLLLGTMVACAFISMWVNNTTTTIMMIPLGLALINAITEEANKKVKERFSTAFLLGIAYSASLGGIATLVGSTPNIFLKGFLESNYNITINFTSWMIVGLPVAIVSIIFSWVWMGRNLKSNGYKGKKVLHEFRVSLGKVTKGELIVAIVFICTALSWVLQKPLTKLLSNIFSKSVVYNDTVIAMLAAVVLFTIPLSLKKKEFILDWKATRSLPWGMLLLFGGGLALSVGIKDTGLSTWFGNLIPVEGLPLIIIIAIATIVVLFLTEINSNTATSATFLPILAAVAVNINEPNAVLYLTMPAAMAASCAFMMPISTPPNAIAYATESFPLKNMMRHGFVLNIAAIIIITLLCYYLIGIMVRFV